LVCPICDKNDHRNTDWCPSCGAYLGLLTRRPRHVGACIRISIFVGVGLFLALAWQIFVPLLEGWPVGQPNRWFWLGFALATFFLTLGLTARQHLVSFLRRRPRREAPADAPGSAPH
jgi:hypothetical protein